jgi:hypothetical protein
MVDASIRTRDVAKVLDATTTLDADSLRPRSDPEDGRQFVAGVDVLLLNLTAQRDAIDRERLSRHSSLTQESISSQENKERTLDHHIAKELSKGQAIAAQEHKAKVELIAFRNRQHVGKITAIQKKMIDEEKQVLTLIAVKEKEEQERDQRLRKRMAEMQRERHHANELREQKLQQKLQAFDQQRMQALEKPPRQEGDLAKDLLNDNSRRQILLRHQNQAATPQPLRHSQRVEQQQKRIRAVQAELMDMQMEKMKEKEKVLSERIRSVELAKRQASSYLRARRLSKEEGHSRKLQSILEHRENSWRELWEKEAEQQKKLDALKETQQQKLAEISLERQCKFIETIDRSKIPSRHEDRWAHRARLLITTVCESIAQCERDLAQGSKPLGQLSPLSRGFERK